MMRYTLYSVVSRERSKRRYQLANELKDLLLGAVPTYIVVRVPPQTWGRGSNYTWARTKHDICVSNKYLGT